MKILYMSIAYNLNGNGLYQNLVETLLKRNHEVTLVRSKYDIEDTKYENIKLGFNVLTIKTPDPFSRNLIKKGLNQVFLSYYFKTAIKKYLKDEKFDLILYATPPVTLASVVKYCKEKYQAKTFLMLKDIFPQNAVDLEMIKKDSLIYKYFRKQEKKYYQYSDFIGCMSQGNIDYVLNHNSEAKKEKIGLFPNSILIDKIKGLSHNEDKTVFMFGGNLGKPQNISFLLEIVKKLKNYSKAEFWIVGEGTEEKKIINFLEKEKCSNFIYKSFVPQKEYEQLLKSVDVGIISLDPRFTIPNIPSRLQGYLKLKKSVLAITDVNTDLKQMILEHNCGWWCDASDEDKVVETIKYICENKEEQIEKGKNGFEYLKEEFDVEKNVDILEKFMKEF